MVEVRVELLYVDMVGLFSDVKLPRAEVLSRKRRTDEIVKEGNRIEEKKLRVEQVVTALSNTEMKKKQISKKEEKKENSPVITKDASCACGANTPVNLSTAVQFYTHTFNPSTNVTFALNPKLSPGEPKHPERVNAVQNNSAYFHHMVLPVRSVHQQFMKVEGNSPPIINPEVTAGSNMLPTPLHAHPFFPVLRDNAVRLNQCGYKNIDIIRVPRDNKTPLVVFKPELHPGHRLARPRFSGSTACKKTIQSISLPSRMSPIPLPSNVAPVCSTILLPTGISNPLTRARDNPTVPMPSIGTNYSVKKQMTRRDDVENQKWSAILIQPEEQKRAVSMMSYFDSDDRENEEMSKYPERLSMWSIGNVHAYFKGTDCSEYADVFKLQEIDGKALRLLDEISISRLLEVKMGPAIKLTALIKSLIDKMVE